jgi:2-polyprenyl-6-methoxyphenol hydroxylase-like FAD-dependent oxidoreductase
VRILVVGGGMAGMTLAGELRARGITPVVVERAPEYQRVGFWIGLYPFSANTLRETGVYERYAEQSLAMSDYVMCDAHGNELQRMSLAHVLASIGGYMGALPRADLLELLVDGASGADLRMGTTVESLDERGEGVHARLSSGETFEADLVVGADGMHSQTRNQILGDTPLEDWGYTAFTWWTPESDAVSDNVLEFWGAGALFGLYPLKGAVNAIAAIPTPDNLDGMEQDAIRDRIREAFADYPPPVQDALQAMGDDRVFPWAMIDQRSPDWVKGRIALVGDAATGFLPTAGVGASNAMKSAAVLADELGRADAGTVPQALSLWEQRVREKVERNQQDSRRLAKMMFVRGHTVAKARDTLLKHYPVEKVAEDVLKSNTTPF